MPSRYFQLRRIYLFFRNYRVVYQRVRRFLRIVHALSRRGVSRMPNGVIRRLSRFPSLVRRVVRHPSNANRVFYRRLTRRYKGRFHVRYARRFRRVFVNRFFPRVGDGALIRRARHVARQAIPNFYRVARNALLSVRLLHTRRLHRAIDGHVCKGPIGVMSLATKWGHGQSLIYFHNHGSGGCVYQ